ncbi:MAG: ABC1 kinase family protein [Omnitrophica WOR_2 bacterium]
MIRSRYRRITFFFARVLISLFLWELIFPRIGLKKWSSRTRSGRLSRIAAQFRLLAIQLGGVLIKVGQFFSSRVDVLPVEITEELAGLQDEVPAEPLSNMIQVAEQEFGAPVNQKFDHFEEVPVAAASLGQVHRAVLIDGSPCRVVVKIQRPNIETIIATDLSALRTVGNWVQKYPPVRRRADVPALLAEFTRILYEEIDYIAEGHHAETFADNFKANPLVRVPKVFWDHTTRRVLTLEDVHSIKITDYEAITSAGIDRSEVAHRLLNAYLKQIFEDGFFHADPHPGNLFVNPISGSIPAPCEDTPALQAAQPARGIGSGQAAQNSPVWQLTFIDFGMVGRVPEKMLAGMRELLIGMATRDAARLVKSYQLLGVLLPGADLTLLKEAEEEAFKRFYGLKMNELTQISLQEMYDFAKQFRSLIYNLPFQIPEDLILLGRCVGILSGMCTGLDPMFNVWEGIAPFARKLVMQEAAASGSSWVSVITSRLQTLVELPKRTDTMLEKMERGELAVHDPQLNERMRKVEHAVRKAAGAIVFAALLLSGVQLILGGQAPLGQALFVGAGAVFLWILFSK